MAKANPSPTALELKSELESYKALEKWTVYAHSEDCNTTGMLVPPIASECTCGLAQALSGRFDVDN
jgi:hypothetical protein